jgi:hypothetical protein
MYRDSQIFKVTQQRDRFLDLVEWVERNPGLHPNNLKMVLLQAAESVRSEMKDEETSTKISPGPWVWVSDGYCTQLLDANGEVVMDDGSAGGEYAPVIEPDSANAHLIAAAPELLSAIKALMNRALKDAEHYAPEGNEPIWAFIADASDAIAKARDVSSADKPTGETP